MRKVLFILGELADSDVEWLASVAEKQVVDEAAILVREGTQISQIFVLLEGQLSVRTGSNGFEVNRLFPGELIGELSFLDSRPASATVVAATRSTVACIARTALDTKLQHDLGFASRFYRALGVFLAHRLRRQTVIQTRRSSTDSDVNEELGFEDEIDPKLLDATALAARRFEWFQKRFSVH